MDGRVIQHIVDATNECAAAFFRKFPSKKTINGIKWFNIDVRTLYVFLGLCMVMGVNKLPRIADYWSHDPTFGGPAIFCAAVMSRNKFFDIMKFIRFARWADVDPLDKPT